MNESEREIQRQIGEVLLRQWDPIGVADELEAHSEYESYVGGVYGLLVRSATSREIAERLVRIETERLGFEDSRWRMLVPVAKRLQRLYARLSISPPRT